MMLCQTTYECISILYCLCPTAVSVTLRNKYIYKPGESHDNLMGTRPLKEKLDCNSEISLLKYFVTTSTGRR